MKRIGTRIFPLLFLATALGGCKTQAPSPAGAGPGSESGGSRGETTPPAQRKPGLGNGEAYNGPILSGTSIPSAPPPKMISVGEIETAVLYCHRDFVRQTLQSLFEGPVAVLSGRSSDYVVTRPNRADPRAFYTQTEGDWTVNAGHGQEFAVTWSALGGKVVPRRSPPETPFFNLDVRLLHTDHPMVQVKLAGPLPLLAFALNEPTAKPSPEAEVSHVWFQRTELPPYHPDAELPLRELSQCLQFRLAEGREVQPGSLEKWEAQDRFVKSAFQRFKFTGEASLIRLVQLGAPDNRPLQIIFWDRPERAAVHRSMHHVALNPQLMNDGEILFLLVHELAHRAQPSFDADEQKFKTHYYRTLRLGQALKEKPSALTGPIRKVLSDYVDAGLEVQLLNEWRVWTTAFDIYLKVKSARAGLGSLAPWQSIPWVEQILAQKLPGEDLKQFTFRYLDGRFTDAEDAERPYLDVVIKERRQKLREEMAHSARSLRDLEFVYLPN